MWGDTWEKCKQTLGEFRFLDTSRNRNSGVEKIALTTFMVNYSEQAIEMESKYSIQDKICKYYTELLHQIYLNNSRASPSAASNEKKQTSVKQDQMFEQVEGTSFFEKISD